MFKKLFFLSIICFATIASIAQKPVTITGVLKNNKMPIKPVKLFKVIYGQCVEKDSFTPAGNGNFSFLFYPDYTGLYVIGTGTDLKLDGNYKFYLKGGDKLSLDIFDWDYQLTGTENSKENIALAQWHHFTDSIYQKAINFTHSNSTYIDFFPQLERTAVQAKTWLKGKRTGNPEFDKMMPGIILMDLALYATNFLHTPHSAFPSTEDLSQFYVALETKNISKTTDMVYNYPWGIRVMRGLIGLDMRKAGIKLGENIINNIQANLSYVHNDTLKGDIVLNSLGGLKIYEDYKQIIDAFGKYIITDEQKSKNVAIVAPLVIWKKGKDAFNFSYPDVNGRQVSLKDMNGKVVLVDVWATWCGPCKRQMPYLKKMEEEMRGQDIEFVSISLDEPEDKSKWLKMIDTAKLGGIQLFAGGWSDITEYYQITNIPRFMIFDKNGKIVSVYAPQPNEPELKELLLKTLSE